MIRKMPSIIFVFALLVVFLPIARAGMAGCGPGSGSTLDPTCTGNVTLLPDGGYSSAGIGISITSISLNPADPPFILQADAVNGDQFSFAFSTDSGTVTVTDVTNNAYFITGSIAGFTPGNDSVALSIDNVVNTYDVVGGFNGYLAPGGTPLVIPGTPPGGVAVINFTGDPVVTGMTFSFATPEPSTGALLMTGLFGLLLFVRRDRSIAPDRAVRPRTNTGE